MTYKELKIVRDVLANIKPRENSLEPHGKVGLAIRLIDKDIAVREAQKDNFKDMYEYEEKLW